MKLCKNKLHEMTIENTYQRTKKKRPPTCRACKQAAEKRYAIAHRIEISGYQKRNHIQRTYGVTPEQFKSMVARQQGNCAICGEAMKNPQVDHSHTTKEVRELLCTSCNQGLGMFRDSPQRLNAAVAYLERHGVDNVHPL